MQLKCKFSIQPLYQIQFRSSLAVNIFYSLEGTFYKTRNRIVTNEKK